MIPRRLLIALAVLVALTAVAAGVTPQQRTETDDGPPRVAPGSQTSTVAVERTLATDAQGDDRRVSVPVGTELRLLVEGDEIDSVQLGELDVQPVDPDAPAMFDLVVDEEGSYPIRLLEADRAIGTLEVTRDPGA